MHERVLEKWDSRWESGGRCKKMTIGDCGQDRRTLLLLVITFTVLNRGKPPTLKEENHCGFYCNANKGSLGMIVGRRGTEAFPSFIPKKGIEKDIPFPLRYCPFGFPTPPPPPQPTEKPSPRLQNRSYLFAAVGEVEHALS